MAILQANPVDTLVVKDERKVGICGGGCGVTSAGLRGLPKCGVCLNAGLSKFLKIC